MYTCAYCQRNFYNVLWKTPDNRAVCINCAVLEKREAVFSPDDREVPKQPAEGRERRRRSVFAPSPASTRLNFRGPGRPRNLAESCLQAT